MKMMKAVMVVKESTGIAILGDDDGQRGGCRQRRQMREEDGREH